MKFAALASGSSGNSFIVENKNKLLLFDAGISRKQIFERMKLLNLNPENIDSVFITHEHIDHIRGLDVLKKNVDADIFMTKDTFFNSKTNLESDQINFIKSGDIIKKAGIEVNVFNKRHDVDEPVSFLLRHDKSLGIMTDIGSPCRNVIDAVEEADSLVLENNYDEDMLMNGRYPIFLKRRISHDYGHLSNKQASLLVLEHAKPKLNNLVLAHLSINNNTEELAYNNMVQELKNRKKFKPKITVSTRYKPTEMFRV